jgi:thioredoxin-related protein
MKKIAILMFSCCALLQAVAADPGWLTDVPQAIAKAKKENKMVLLDFTGSDWCSWCLKFKNEALETQEFAAYAAKNLVCVEVDFPRRTPMSAALKQANKALAAQYQVESYPTFVIVSKDGKELGRQKGYRPGGPQPFITKLENLKAKN